MRRFLLCLFITTVYTYDVFLLITLPPVSRLMLLQHIDNNELKTLFYEVRAVLRDKRVNYGIIDFYYQKDRQGPDSARMIQALDSGYRMINLIAAFYEEVDMELQRRS